MNCTRTLLSLLAWLPALLSAGATVPARAQGSAPGSEQIATLSPRPAGDSARDASRWDLPRLFYEARQRRSLDAQDRALHLGLSPAGSAAAGPRFDGYVSGPNGTHAWVSGGRYVADGAGKLHPADERAADTAAGGLEEGSARLDRTRGVLVVRREAEGTLRLRVGEADAAAEAPPPAADSVPAIAPPGGR